MNEAENNDANGVEAAVDAAMANNPISDQEVTSSGQEQRESSQIGADAMASVPLNKEAETKSEPGETQTAPESDATKHEEPAGEEQGEPSGDLNNVTDPPPVAEPVQEPIADTRLDDVLSKLDMLSKGVDEKSAGISEAFRELMEAFKIKLQYDAAKQQVIDRQAASLAKYEKGLIDELIYKIANPILIQYTNMMDIASHYAALEKTPENFDRLLDEFTGFGNDLLQTVEDAGMTPFYADTGSRFDPHRQKVLKRVATDNKDKDRTISRVICPGLERNGRVFRPLQAEVLIYSEPTKQS